ncbi:hypothetical protein [Streptomyces rochei]|uniref:hypothetical protein n=1 Tax=Streptomyces rochei TaxID=1928 RepID=UPI00368ADF8D
MNAILYVAQPASPGATCPGFPQASRGYSARWEEDGIFDQLTGPLRGKACQRKAAPASPVPFLIDSQGINTSATVL